MICVARVRGRCGGGLKRLERDRDRLVPHRSVVVKKDLLKNDGLWKC